MIHEPVCGTRYTPKKVAAGTALQNWTKKGFIGVAGALLVVAGCSSSQVICWHV
jgi:hypothetical protein